MGDATAQHALRGAGLSQTQQQNMSQLPDVVGLTVSERMFRRMPGRLDRVEFGCVDWEFLQMQARILSAESIKTLSMVDPCAIPNDEDVAAQMFEQVPEKIFNLIARNVFRVEPEVEAESATLRANRQAANDRDPGVVVSVANDRSLADRCPGAPDGWNQHEARFIGEDAVRTQPRSVFFTRGQSLRFHCSMRASSRSSARRSGFWQLKPNSCSRRAT